MHATPLTWTTRALWLLLPVTLGDLVATAASTTDSGVAIAALAWAVFAAGCFSSFVMLPPALTLLRVLAPLPLLAGAVAAATVTPDALGWIGMATAASVLVAALSAEVGGDFLNGSAYGDEQRVGLRIPAPLLLGPVEVVWVLTALPIPTAVVLAADHRPLPAVLVGVVGVACSVVGLRVLHRLARRCLVLVPAGITIVDDLALAEPILLRRDAIVRLGPAPADTAALDLTGGAGGLILQVDLSEPVDLVRATRRGRIGEEVGTAAVLVAPSRPGRLLSIAEQRRISVGRT